MELIYIEKSASNKLQRRLYSGQKRRPLIKPFVVCCSNGYIVDVFGPYGATDNEASILLHVLENQPDFRNILIPKDNIILDRGFRDILPTLRQKYLLEPNM